MIESFKHRGLKRLFEKGDRSKISPLQLDEIELILVDLDVAATIAHLDRPGYRLHSVRGQMQGYYAIDVSANWRIVFRFEAGVATDINLVDYH